MNTFSGYGLISPQAVYQSRQRFHRDVIPELAYASSYYSLSGNYPDIGWLLLDRHSYNKLNQYATTHELILNDYVNPTITISNLSIIQARCVTRGLEADSNAIYLIQVTNNQGVLYNPWFQFPLDAQYNVRSPAYPDLYYTESLNAGAPFTWSTMLEDMWDRATTHLGPFPGLPTEPSGLPENFVFMGKPLWGSINKVLSYLGFAVTGTYPDYDIVVRGADDNSYGELSNLYSKALIDDMEYLDGGSGRVPGEVVVYFHRRNEYYGTEETVRRDSLQWQNEPSYSITVNAPAQFADAAGTGHLWADYTVHFDADGNPLAGDVATATAIAAERAAMYYRSIYRGNPGFLRRTYGGLIPFNTGSLVDGVRWYNCVDSYGEYRGWHTEIIRGYVWPEATFLTNLEGFSVD